MSRISKVFQSLKAQGEGALVGYVTAGDPEPKLTPIIAEALVKGGVDILELGIPFSDPIADGPTIQAASVRALQAGTTPKMVLEMVGEIKNQRDVPVAILTYYNPVFRMGLDKFFGLAKSSGVDGVIVADLPVEEAADYKEAAETCGVDTIFLAAPSTSAARLQRIVESTSGFLYLVSHFGVTGEQAAMEHSTIQLIQRVLPVTRGRVPLAVGFGISKPEHVKAVIGAGADGAIVGSAFVNIVSRCRSNVHQMLNEIEKTACKLKESAKQHNA
ncbi:MAG: tryptophan synthase subunit alpha [Candidatus Bathyarchaeota archaeon]|nr:tryptophan synthase subunit alpha [Candidatus Bathyarchaeota archaeon]